MMVWGAVVLSLWAALNAAMALVVLVLVLAGRDPLLALIVFEPAELETLDRKARESIRALAVLFNSALLALMSVELVLVWAGALAAHPWAFWTVAGTGIFVQAMGLRGDALIGSRSRVPNLVSTTLLAVGLALMTAGGAAGTIG